MIGVRPSNSRPLKPRSKIANPPPPSRSKWIQRTAGTMPLVHPCRLGLGLAQAPCEKPNGIARRTSDILPERKFRHNHRVGGNVVQFGFKVDAWVIVIEPDGAPYRSIAVECAGSFHDNRHRAFRNLDSGGFLARGRDARSSGTRRHLIAG